MTRRAQTVLNQPGGRVKVVNVINYCGAPDEHHRLLLPAERHGPRPPSSSYEPCCGARVRHNLDWHATDSRAIMFATATARTTASRFAECRVPYAGGQRERMLTVAARATDDGDRGGSHRQCPLVANERPADSDGDGIGTHARRRELRDIDCRGV